MRTLREIIKRAALRKNRLEAALAGVIEQLRQMGALKIFLFGSFCKNQITPSSDLDLLVIMPSVRTSKEWLSLIYEQVDRGVACDILVYNLEDYQKNKDKSLMLKEISKKGRVVYEKAEKQRVKKMVYSGKR